MSVSYCSAETLAVTVVTLEGEAQSDKLIAITETDFKFEQGSRAFKDVSEVRFSDAPTPVATPTMRLRNGDQLKAVILSGDDAKFKLKSNSLGELEVENKFLCALVFPFKEGVATNAIDDFLKASTPKEDLLLLSKGDTLSGFIEKFTDKDMSFNVGGQSRIYAFEQVAALRLAALEKYKAPTDLRATLELREGSFLTGKLIELKDNIISFEALNGKIWKVDASQTQSILFKGGKLVYLSDLQPKTVEEKPYIGGLPVVYRWRRDQSVTTKKLKLGAQTYSRGLGVHSYSRLVYDLDGRYVKFLCDVGLDISAPHIAVCAWKIIVDEKVAASGVAKVAEKPQTLKIELRGAKQLELICDFGPDDDDIGDHLDWAAARLIKQ
ncbi:MAG: NPCBM/NEW2 domain-containing protein [Planctomycetota bacterium]